MSLNTLSRLCFLILSLFAFSKLSSQTEKPRYNSLLWEISKPDSDAKPSYLYGTMHVSRKLVFNLSDTFYLALKQCDAVALELDLDAWMEDIVKTQEHLEFDSRNGLNSSTCYGTFEIEEVDKKVFEYTLSKGNNLANLLLYRNSKDTDFEENTYLDMFIFQAAHKMGKTLIGLEDPRFVDSCVYMASQPKPGASRNSYYSRDIYEEIETAYREGDLSKMDSLDELIYEGTNFREWMLDKRNIEMADRMDEIIQSGKTLFTGVGAAHLPNEMGVIELMRQKGYIVRPIDKKVSDFSVDNRQEIELMIAPVANKKVVSPDSLFKAELPGTPYIMSTGSIVSTYFYPEMRNGTYYVFSKINTFSPLFDKTLKDQSEMIEDLLYENIPGKIIDKKIIKSDTLTTIFVTNQTRKGDYQRYKIFVTPTFTLVGKMAGTNEYAKGKFGEDFFNSFQLIEKSTESTLNLGKVSLYLGKGKYNETFSHYPQTLESYATAEVYDTNQYTFVIHNQYIDINYIEEDSFELHHIIYQFAKGIEYSVDTTINKYTNGSLEIASKLIKEGKKDIFLNLKIVGPNYYLIGSMGKDSLAANRASESLVINYLKPNEVVEYVDTAFFFKTKTYANVEKINGKKYVVDPDINVPIVKNYSKSIDKNITIIEPTGNEKIRVNYRQYNPYTSFENFDSLHADITWKIEHWSDLKAYKNEHLVEKDRDVLFYEFRDSTSVRNIYSKYIFIGSSYYNLSYNSDTLKGMSDFAQLFFDNFEPTKDLSKNSLFESKSKLFFEDFRSTDSVTVVTAYKSLDYVEFKKEDLDTLDKLIKNERDYSPFLKDYKVKEALLEAVSEIKDDKAIAYLHKFILENPDSFALQAKVIKYLSRIENEKAFATIQKILLENRPYIGSYDISSIFKSMYDSLELTKTLFPELLALTRYGNYRDEIYQLLATDLERNVLKAGTVRKNKKEILSDAMEEIKQKITVTGNSYSSYSSYTSKYPDYDEIETYLILLSTLKNNKQTKEFVHLLDQIKKPETKLKYDVALLKNGFEINDTLLAYYAKNEFLRYNLYDGLKRINKLELMDSTYLSADNLAKSFLYSHAFDEDSIVFLEKKLIKQKNSEGYLYFYKRYSKERKRWSLDYTGLLPEKELDFDNVKASRNNKLKDNTEKELKESIDEIVTEFQTKGRKRVRSNSDYYYDDYYEF